ncbi:MAG: GGDEF domain-containing protein [Candidatus Velthaea sp.]
MNDGDPIAFLTERLAAAERERDELAERTARLEALQRVFVQISAAADEAAIAAAALRGARRALEFTRALWFSVAGTGTVVAAYELDEGTEPVESAYGDAFPAGSSLVRSARGGSDAATGYAGDTDAALYDVRSWYALAALRVPVGSAAILYADGARERHVAAWSVEALRELAMQAALALENIRLRGELERLAHHDPLTGLFNRRALAAQLDTELARARRSGRPFGFAMIDIDDFKRINDTSGHAAGDAAIVAFGSALRNSIRVTDVPARFAGDEFALIMPETDATAAEAVMVRFYAAVRGAGLSCSTGIAFSSADRDAVQLFAAADAAVYAAKAAGKNTWRFG